MTLHSRLLTCFNVRLQFLHCWAWPCQEMCRCTRLINIKDCIAGHKNGIAGHHPARTRALPELKSIIHWACRLYGASTLGGLGLQSLQMRRFVFFDANFCGPKSFEHLSHRRTSSPPCFRVNPLLRHSLHIILLLLLLCFFWSFNCSVQKFHSLSSGCLWFVRSTQHLYLGFFSHSLQINRPTEVCFRKTFCNSCVLKA